jgi:hypothetical protein
MVERFWLGSMTCQLLGCVVRFTSTVVIRPSIINLEHFRLIPFLHLACVGPLSSLYPDFRALSVCRRPSSQSTACPLTS